MKEFIDMLNAKQYNFLKSIKLDFEQMDTADLFEWLTDYFQEQGLEDIEKNPSQLLLESILDILGSL